MEHKPIVHTHPKPPRVGRQAKRVMVVCGIVVGIAIIAGIIVSVEKGRNQQKVAIDSAQQIMDSSIESGEYTKSYEQLKAMENKVTGKQQKILLYSYLAAAAANVGKMGEALHYYELKHSLDPASQATDGYLVGVLYERKGEPDKALAAYKQNLTYLQSQPKDAEGQVSARIESLQQAIADLEASLQ